MVRRFHRRPVPPLVESGAKMSFVRFFRDVLEREIEAIHKKISSRLEKRRSWEEAGCFASQLLVSEAYLLILPVVEERARYAAQF
ncbi:hypothetical protein AK812_SmicGene23707 [Symbiodinium microadriaticum]|uniref:Uncharacterized protein n=1 Tax=Symbiodinium microadriaticum TaxID=2951 RepID=A0A1Q9DGI9_SYMMI|nr:hypothetical protein AK812_SmicGene23707 [Symbiodinium microadriaticum]